MMMAEPHTVRCLRIDEPEGLLAAMPGVEMQAVPLRTGPFGVEILRFDLGDVVFQAGACTPNLAFAAARPATAVVQLPLAGVETLILNGQPAAPRMVGLYGPNGTLERSNPQPSRYAILVLPAHAVGALLAPPSDCPLLRPGAQGLFWAGPDAWKRAVDLARDATATASADPRTFDGAEPRRSLRVSLLHAMRELIADQDVGEGARPLCVSPARRRIVRMADAYLRANPMRPIYTDDLCDALDTSASSLSQAFRATFGITPHRFLKLRRLAMVRTALCAHEGPEPLVKTVALSHGFWHLGQFAHDYRAMYGEVPSETLARTGSDAAGRRARRNASRRAEPATVGP
jgi:AraC family ethanolamine operon transcriptional activator